MRIAYCIESFWNTGGMERILSVKANWLSQHGYDITIFIANQDEKPYAFPLEENITVVDLDVNFNNKSNLLKDYSDKLSQRLELTHYDIVVSMGGMDLYFLHNIQDYSQKIVEFHFSFTRAIKNAENAKMWLKALLTTLRTGFHAIRYNKVISLTNHDYRIYKALCGDKSLMIANPISINDSGEIASLNTKRTIAVGRLNYQKGFDILIDVWALVHKKHPGWSLHIFGEGPVSRRRGLQTKISRLQLDENIILEGNSNNIVSEYIASSICICSSRYEGFSLALCEASACGLPLVAFDCPSGPGDIVINGKNGFLIKKVGDSEAMADAICKLIEDDDLRKRMGQCAKESSRRYELNGIMNQWTQLFKQVASCT